VLAFVYAVVIFYMLRIMRDEGMSSREQLGEHSAIEDGRLSLVR
jgi:hypothetical protein